MLLRSGWLPGDTRSSDIHPIYTGRFRFSFSTKTENKNQKSHIHGHSHHATRAGQYFNVKRDGRYINAQIVRNASHKKVQVMYLDTGNTSYVPLHDLWSLKGPRLAALKKKLEKDKKKEKKESAPTLPVPVPVPVPYAPPQELTQQDVPQDIPQEQPVQTPRTVRIVPTRYKPGQV